MISGPVVIVLVLAVAMTLAAGVCFVLAAIESRKVCLSERCREERGAPKLDRVWERVGRRVQGRRRTTSDDGRGPRDEHRLGR